MEAVNNKRQSRFEVALPDGEFATLEYRWLKGSMVLMHTLVPVSARHKGVGAMIVKYALEYARAHSLTVIVYCPFVTKYMHDHPEYNDLVEGSSNE